MALGYLKSKFEVGSSFIIPHDLVTPVLEGSGVVSALGLQPLVDAYFNVAERPLSLQRGDVHFTVVDAHPEAKFRLRASHVVGQSSEIVVRRFSPCVDANILPQQWHLETWDLRGWLASPESFMYLAANLLRVVDSTQEVVFKPRPLPELQRTRPNTVSISRSS